MKLQVGTNFEFLFDNFDFNKSNNQIKQGFVLEGGSGAAKSWDIIQFIIYYCQKNLNKNKDILFFRATFADLKKTVLKDFEKILRMYGLYDINKHFKSSPTHYELFGNTIYFTGLDGIGSHGERHDIIWGNEGMELDFESFKQLNQRCNEAFFIDYNPSFTEHWIFNSIITRPDTKFFKSTQLDNPFLPEGQRQEILSYEPTAINIKNGTADEFMWKVYGLGERSASQGTIFKHVNYIDRFPDNLNYSFGLDFGYTNDPTALVKLALDGQNNLYAELLCYEPIDNSLAIDQVFTGLKIQRQKKITADSSDKFNDSEMVLELRNKGWNIEKANKSKGITWRLGLLKKHKLNIVSNVNFKRELQNYKWREINGILINEPVDKYNHAIDALGYGYLGMQDQGYYIRRTN